MAVEAAEGHVLVDEHPLVPLRAEADQTDKVGMGEHRQHQHLRQELIAPLHTLPGELLHRHHLLRIRVGPGDLALVHLPEAANEIGVVQVAGGLEKVLEGEADLHPCHRVVVGAVGGLGVGGGAVGGLGVATPSTRKAPEAAHSAGPESLASAS